MPKPLKKPASNVSKPAPQPLRSSRFPKFIFIFLVLLFLGAAAFFIFMKKSSDDMFFIENIEKGSMVQLGGRANTYDLSVKNETTYLLTPYGSQKQLSVTDYLGKWDIYFHNHHPLAALKLTDDAGNVYVTLGELESAARHGEKNRIDYTFRLLDDTEKNQISLSLPIQQQRTDKFKKAKLIIFLPSHGVTDDDFTK